MFGILKTEETVTVFEINNLSLMYQLKILSCGMVKLPSWKHYLHRYSIKVPPYRQIWQNFSQGV